MSLTPSSGWTHPDLRLVSLAEFPAKWPHVQKQEKLVKQTLRDESSIPWESIKRGEFLSTCQEVQDRNTNLSECKKKRDAISKKKPIDEEALARANEAVQKAQAVLDTSVSKCQSEASNILASDPKMEHFLSVEYDDTGDPLLLTNAILCQAHFKYLWQWGEQSPERKEQILRLLHDTNLQRDFLAAGGIDPKYRMRMAYGKCMEAWCELQAEAKSNPVLQRMVTAIALECAPEAIKYFKTKTPLDAKKRYVHLSQAYLLGELDPNFSTFDTWHMRHVVNCDASEEDMGWGRQCLMNYRPDICVLQDPKWQYSQVVRWDVGYRNPAWWDPEHLDYPQILSGGGQCGPRAWMGRFCCKTFGIPTWGVRQPGHAAMTRWSSEGWQTVLGGGWNISWWTDGRKGLDFHLETEARRALPSEVDYFRKITRLEILGLFCDEKYDLLGDALPHPDSPWYSLSLMHRKIIAAAGKYESPILTKSKIETQIERYITTSDERGTVQCTDGTIVVPADTASEPTTNTPNVIFMKSFSGGKQVYLKEKSIEYTINDFLVPNERLPFELVLKVCTVHKDEAPMLLTLTAEGDDSVVDAHEVPIPYSKGMWENTMPVMIAFGGPQVKKVKFSFTRDKEKKTYGGIVIKELIISPIRSP